MPTQTLSQFMWYQRRRVAAYMPPRVISRQDLLAEDVYEGPAEIDEQMEFCYRRGLVIAGERA